MTQYITGKQVEVQADLFSFGDTPTQLPTDISTYGVIVSGNSAGSFATVGSALTVYYYKMGSLVHLTIQPSIELNNGGASLGAGLITVVNVLPAEIRPLRDFYFTYPAVNNSLVTCGVGNVQTGGAITFGVLDGGATDSFSAAGNLSVSGSATVMYNFE